MTIFEIKGNKLIIGGHQLPPGDIVILKNLLRTGKSSAFDLAMLSGKMYVQYVQYRLRVLCSPMLGIVVNPERGKYEINPEIKDELIEALKQLGVWE